MMSAPIRKNFVAKCCLFVAPVHTDQIVEIYAKRPDTTLVELKAELGTHLSTTTLCVALRKLKLTFKKKVLVASEQQRKDVAVKRRWWQRRQRSLGLDQLVFLDETWIKTNMTRLRGRSLIGKRLVEHVPHGHWKTTTFLAAIRSSGWVAPLVVDDAINGALFLAWVQQHLIKSLRPGDVVIMDNLSSHTVKGVADAIESVNAQVLYLPPYSPDFNPIELAFSKFKQLIRSTKNRTVDKLWKSCDELLERFNEPEFRNYFTHAGYRYT